MELNNTDRISAAKFYSLVWEVRHPFDKLRNEKRFKFLEFFRNSSRFQVFVALSKSFGEGEAWTKNEILDHTDLTLANLESILKQGVEKGILNTARSDDDARVRFYVFHRRHREALGEFWIKRQFEVWLALGQYIGEHVSPNIWNELVKTELSPDHKKSIMSFMQRKVEHNFKNDDLGILEIVEKVQSKISKKN
ncbi:MAG: hypothetical protein ACKJRP_06370 [SAR86 cluster bacterium]|jgi:DNA-binding MarR family transcriptional regulator|tara:strand:- start:782 stop:1363 length:582 start_codon:yes stop_codon:yes gene_type:complete